MKKIIIALLISIIGVCAFADSYFQVYNVKLQKGKLNNEVCNVYLYNSNYKICYSLPSYFYEDLKDLKGYVKLHDLKETCTGGKKETVDKINNIINFYNLWHSISREERIELAGGEEQMRDINKSITISIIERKPNCYWESYYNNHVTF